MKDIDLTPALRQKMVSYPRKRGRYNSSELYGITAGYLTPEQWMNGRDKTVEDMLKMWMGTLVHDHSQRLLPPGGNEVKKEHYYNGIVLVAKVDHLPDPQLDNSVWEIKTDFDLIEHAKAGHEYQGKIYCSIFERPITKILQPVSSFNGLFLKNIGEVERDDAWFTAQLEKLFQFHLRVEKLWEKLEAGQPA